MNLEAVFPPIPTPFIGDDVDAAAIRANISKLMETGLGGIVALGSNGEAPLLDENESDRVIAAAREATPSSRVLIAGTGRESTQVTIAASKRAAALGADAVLVRTPSYFKGRMTADAFVAHYTAVADRSPVPVLIYNYPAATGVNISAAAVGRLSQHPNIVGIKETGSDTAQVAEFVAASSDRFTVIAGSAPTFYSSLCVGARGAILAVACVVPDICVTLLQHYRAGRHDDARALQRRLTPLARLVTSVHGVPGLKAALDLVGFRGGPPRSPLAPCPKEGVEEIRRELAAVQTFAAAGR
jgi:4-hydroxy-2-oxoglutarate aldolase